MKGKARIIEADRSQLSWDLIDLDAWLPEDHLARVIWAFTGTLDLSPFTLRLSPLKARRATRPSTRVFRWRFGFTQRPRAPARRANSTGFAVRSSLIAGSRAGFR